MKTTLLFLSVFLLVPFISYPQCFQKLYETEDSTSRVFAIHQDGSLWGWGYGYLGNSVEPSSFTPVVISNENDWHKIYNSFVITLALKNDSTLWGWGANYSGQMMFENSVQLVPFKLDNNKWISIASSWGRVFGIKADGTLWRWGDNWPNGNIINPLQVGNESDWKLVNNSYSGISLIKDNGSLWLTEWQPSEVFNPQQFGSDVDWTNTYVKPGWQNENYGMKTNGQLIDLSTNTEIVVGAQWLKVSCGEYSCMGIQTDGSLWGWGVNWNGELGIGNTAEQTLPVQVGFDSNWIDVAMNHEFCHVLKQDGSIYTMGSSSYLGISPPTSQALVPTEIGGCTSSLTELTTSKNLIQILDMMGRETTFKPNTHLIYVYDDGSTEKVFTIE